MKLIIGLGNPGQKYKNNRHNVGHMVIDTLEKAGLPGGMVVKKTDVFMNNSGGAVKKLFDFYKVSPDDLYVIHDDLDIPLGQYKIQKGKGPKLHYGIQSINQALGNKQSLTAYKRSLSPGDKDYWRVRVGVENREVPRVSRVPRVPRGEEYVLQDFTQEEKPIITDVIKQIITDLNGRL